MKKVTIFLLTAFLLVGCSESVYESKIEEGKEALSNQEYEKALASFRSAFEKNYDEEAEVLISQTEKMIVAINQQELGNAPTAIGYYEQVKTIEGGYDRLSEQAEERKEKLMQEEQQRYDEELNNVEKLIENEEYEEAEQLLKAIVYGTEAFKYLEKQCERATEMLHEINSKV